MKVGTVVRDEWRANYCGKHARTLDTLARRQIHRHATFANIIAHFLVIFCQLAWLSLFISQLHKGCCWFTINR
jgi:hypothetical protein